MRGKFLLLGFLLGAVGSQAGMDPHLALTFGHLPPVPAGGWVVVYVMNGPAAQNAQVSLFTEAGQEIATKSQSLSAAGIAGDAFTFAWRNAGSEPLSPVAGVGVGQSFAGVHWVGAVLDSTQSVTMAFDQGSFMVAVSTMHGHAPGVEEPVTVSAFQNYPNPFKGSSGTDIVYAVTGVDRIKAVSMRIWSSGGQLVKNFALPYIHHRGMIHWDGKDESGHPVGTGVYIAEILLESDDGNVSKTLRLALMGG